MIVDPVTVDPEQKISDALEVMKSYRISGVPVTKREIGRHFDQSRSAIRDPLRSAHRKRDDQGKPGHRGRGTTLEEAEAILHRHRIEKLLVVDEHYNLKGLITVKDIQKKLKYPNAAKDAQGRLRVGAALGSSGDFWSRSGIGQQEG